MLVLSREVGKAIMIGVDVRVRVLAIDGGRVTLSVQSPDEVRLRVPAEQLQPKQGGVATLILDRHCQAQIGDDIRLEVVDTRYDTVRLGISAPQHIAVHREEVYEAIKKEHLTLGALLEIPKQAPPTSKLSLWRAVGEGVVVGKDVLIAVLDILDGEVRLSIRTPDQASVDIPAHRQWNLGKHIKAMLAPGARHCVGRGVFVSVQAVERGRAQVGIEAPEDLPILRSETWDRLQGG